MDVDIFQSLWKDMWLSYIWSKYGSNEKEIVANALNTMQRCTVITYIWWLKEIRYNNDNLSNIENIAHISHPLVSSEDIEKIKNTSIDKVQSILSKYY